VPAGCWWRAVAADASILALAIWMPCISWWVNSTVHSMLGKPNTRQPIGGDPLGSSSAPGDEPGARPSGAGVLVELRARPQARRGSEVVQAGGQGLPD
jgi:hypothetical protein